MKFVCFLLTTLVTLFVVEGSAQKKIKEKSQKKNYFLKVSSDNILYADTTRNTEFTIDVNDSRLNKVLSDLLLKKTPEPTSGRLKSDTTFNRFSGMVIDSIFVINGNVYASYDKNGFVRWVQKTVNNTHVITRDEIIRRLLLFSSGDRVDPQLIVQSEALLINYEYLSSATIILKEIGQRRVNAYVVTKDMFSLSFDGSIFYRLNSSIWITENNFLGIGHSLELKEYFNREKKDYFRGMDLSYSAKNIFAKYISADLSGGYGDEYYKAAGAINKEFVKAKDWAGGADFFRSRHDQLMTTLLDSIINFEEMRYGGWVGKSFKTSNPYLNPYVTIRYENHTFFNRPTVSPILNPYFHDRNDLFASVGIYSEQFYSGNWIYGFGNTELIPYGYRVELSGGYRWGEFGNLPYFGASMNYGNNYTFGYLATRFNFGTFFNDKFYRAATGKTLQRTVFSFDLLYFSNLWGAGRRTSVRQFISASYLMGTNMLEGEGARIRFQYPNKGPSDRGSNIGTTRLTIRPETVVFTPVEFTGFRLVGYAFFNLGTIGTSANPFKNDFFSEFGFGIRIKNENFVFKNIQIQIAIGLKNPIGYGNNIYSISSEPRLNLNGFLPQQPNIIRYE